MSGQEVSCQNELHRTLHRKQEEETFDTETLPRLEISNHYGEEGVLIIRITLSMD